jgi:hypothetical protein
LGQLRDHLLAQAGIGARRAALSAVEAFLDAADQAVVCVSAHLGVRTYYFMGVHGRHPMQVDGR